MSDLLNKYNDSLEYYRDKAIVMKPFEDWNSVEIPVGTELVLIKRFGHYFFSRGEGKTETTACRMGFDVDFDCLYLYNLEHASYCYATDNTRKGGFEYKYNCYFNHYRAFTKLEGK